MAPLPAGGTVAVTGAAGFIGSWIVDTLLARGYSVRACVRDVDSPKCDFLKRRVELTTRRLTLHSCDINVDGVFDGVFDGCHAVVHTADALMSGEYSADKHPAMAVKAVQRIIDSINRARTVNRLIYTSSCAAVMHEDDLDEFIRRPVLWDKRYPNYTSEHYANNPQGNGYALAKIACEQTATAAAEASAGRWDCLITNPGDNFGPMLAPHHLKGGGGVFNYYVSRIMAGKKVSKLSVYHPMWAVDVRDDAAGHVCLLETGDPSVRNGDRFCMWSTRKLLMEDLVGEMQGLFPHWEEGEGGGFAPTAEAADDLPEEVQKAEAHFRRIWGAVQLRNDGALAVGTTFRPFAATLRDTVESLIETCGIEPRMMAAKARL